MREIIAEESLQELGLMLGDGGDIWLDYLRAVRDLYGVLVQKNLDVDGYKTKVETFQKTFEECHQMWGLPETLKVHILGSHIQDFLEMTGQTCWSTNDENVECVHQLLERRNLRHNPITTSVFFVM